MTVTLWVAIGVGVLAAVARLLNGYWTRKQIRQAELFRKDASVGLTPPDSPPWAWLKRNLYLLVGVLAPIGGIIFQLGHDHPMTRSDVFFTAYYFGTIAFTLAFTLSIRFMRFILDEVLDIIKTLSDTDAAQLKLIGLIEEKAALQLVHRTAPPVPTDANAAVPASPPASDQNDAR